MSLPDDFRLPPRIEGLRCERCIVARTTADSRLTNEVSHLHLQLDGRWYQVALDYGLIFWRAGVEPQTREDLWTLTDEASRLGIQGATVSEARADDSGNARGMKANLTIAFSNGQRIVLRGINGRTTMLLNP